MEKPSITDWTKNYQKEIADYYLNNRFIIYNAYMITFLEENLNDFLEENKHLIGEIDIWDLLDCPFDEIAKIMGRDRVDLLIEIDDFCLNWSKFQVFSEKIGLARLADKAAFTAVIDCKTEKDVDDFQQKMEEMTAWLRLI